MNQRTEYLEQWLKNELGGTPFELIPLTGDASFRSYFRVYYGNQSAVLMDAPPPEQASCAAFIAIARSLSEAGLHAPDILAADERQGFMLLTDLGDALYLRQLTADNADDLYGDAIKTLLQLQAQISLKYYTLPRFDSAMMQAEVNLFTYWFLERHSGITLDVTKNDLIQRNVSRLIDALQHQPFVCVHRDYHSRNLLVLGEHDVGLLDFQDAVSGPVSYDLVSLFKDCYIDWPRERVLQWVQQYHELASAEGILSGIDFATFLQWFDWMGIQRHLKALGIFARLNYLYNKPSYLDNVPRILRYLKGTLSDYTEWAELNAFFQQHVFPSSDKEPVSA